MKRPPLLRLPPTSGCWRRSPRQTAQGWEAPAWRGASSPASTCAATTQVGALGLCLDTCASTTCKGTVASHTPTYWAGVGCNARRAASCGLHPCAREPDTPGRSQLPPACAAVPAGDLVVTKGDQYDVRDKEGERDVRNLGKPVDLAARWVGGCAEGRGRKGCVRGPLSGGAYEVGGCAAREGGRPAAAVCASRSPIVCSAHASVGRVAAVHVMPILTYASHALPAGHRYFTEGADEVAFLNITGFRDCPLEDLPMLQVRVERLGRDGKASCGSMHAVSAMCVFRQPCVAAMPAAGVTVQLSTDTAVAWLAVNSPRRYCKRPVSACLCR